MKSEETASQDISSDMVVQLMAGVSASVNAAHVEAFANSIVNAFVSESGKPPKLAVAAAVHVHGETSSPLAQAGAPNVLAESDLLSVCRWLASQPSAATSVTSKPVPNSPNRIWIVAPLHSLQQQHGFVLLLAETADVASKLKAMQTAKAATDLASRYFDKQTQLSRQASSATGLAGGLHESLDLKQTSHTVANELRRALGCDRVCVYLKRGSRYRLQSVSGQARINRRANVVQALSKLVRAATRMGEPFFYPKATEHAPQIETTLQKYLDESDAKSIAILPLQRPSPSNSNTERRKTSQPIFAAITVESFQNQGASHETIAGSTAIADATSALHNSRTHSDIFLLPLWRSLGRGLGANPWWKALGAALLVAALIAAFLLIKTEYFIYADGTLQPTVRQRVFAPTSGIVGEILVAHGKQVTAGDTLVEVKNAELEQRFEQLSGELQIAQQKLSALNTRRLQASLPGRSSDADPRAANSAATLSAEQGQLEAQISNLSQQSEIAKQQIDRLQVEAPIAGQVITWDVQAALRSRPVNGGERLLTLADVEGDWQIELELPEARIQTLLDRRADEENLPVRFVLGTAPSEYHEATLTNVADSAQLSPNEGLTVKLIAKLDKDAKCERRVGADVRAKIPCGKRSLGYVCFRDVADFVRRRVLFYLR